MSEKARLTPSNKKYEGPRYNLTESLDVLTARIDDLSMADVVKNLEKYK
jgi:hypothetical protein